jgi:gluconate 2-dehydrogenase gamma chain
MVRTSERLPMHSSEKLDRRTLIHNLVRGGLALGLVPGFAETAWATIAVHGTPATARVLSAAQTIVVAAIADAILPRSDSPSATDVGVPAWVDLVVADYFSATRRTSFLADLAAIDEFAMTPSGLRPGALATLDAACGAKNLTPVQRGYVQLKELVIYGYFTSKPVQQDILKVVIVPGRFDVDVPVAPASAA